MALKPAPEGSPAARFAKLLCHHMDVGTRPRGTRGSGAWTLEQLAAAITEVRSRTSAPFGVNLRTDVDDVADRIDLMIETGARVASFAQAPNPALA